MHERPLRGEWELVLLFGCQLDGHLKNNQDKYGSFKKKKKNLASILLVYRSYREPKQKAQLVKNSSITQNLSVVMLTICRKMVLDHLITSNCFRNMKEYIIKVWGKAWKR